MVIELVENDQIGVFDRLNHRKKGNIMENLFEFQKKAIEKLQEKFGALWNVKSATPVQLLLKAPTGSGKTVISTTFIDSLQVPNEKIENLGKVAFIWITKGDNLVMQSKKKFADYFYPNLRNTLSTFDSCSDTLKENEVLFINWEKLTQSKGKDRLNRRRPEDPNKYKESGFYFEDLMENTHSAGIELILVVDESHSNFDTQNAAEIIKLINPHLIFKMSATPFKTQKDEDDFYAAKGRSFSDIVEIAHSDVVQAGLIKEEIESQTNEDLERTKGTNANIDEVMLDLAIEKREQIKHEWQHLGQNINPLVLIQLPNDDSKIDENVETKEDFTLRYLKKRGIKESNIAVWLEDKKKKAEWRLEDEDSEIDFLIFKLACGTGWDCPRAHILVMFREIKSPVFQTQTLGRIIRMPRPDRELLKNSPLLRKGYLYTTYARNQVGATLVSGTSNKPKIFTSNMDSDIKKTLVKNSLINKLFDFVTTVEIEQKSQENQNEQGKINYAELLSKPVTEIKNAKEVETKKVELQEEKKNEVFAKVKKLVENKIEFLFDRNAENLVISSQTPEYKPNIKKIERVASELKSQAVEIKKEITQTTASLEKSLQTEDEIQMQIETLAGKREAEIVLDECLKNDFIPRSSYNDFGSVSMFQASFKESLHNYFGTHNKSLGLYDDEERFKSFGIDLTPSLTYSIMVDEVFSDEENYNKNSGKTIEEEMPTIDVNKRFTIVCQKILLESKIGNIARSYSALRNSLLVWFNEVSLEDAAFSNDEWEKIFLKDYDKDTDSVFKKAIFKSFQDYEPKRQAFFMQRAAEAKNSSEPFKIKTTVDFDESYEIFNPSEKSLQQPFYLKKEYSGRSNETAFIKYLESPLQNVKYWFKNPQDGNGSLQIKYFDSAKNKERLFLPDWIVLYKDGRIGIFDTKSGITGLKESVETQDKLKGLQKRIEELNQKSSYKYFGGIYEPEGLGEWKLTEKLE